MFVYFVLLFSYLSLGQCQNIYADLLRLSEDLRRLYEDVNLARFDPYARNPYENFGRIDPNDKFLEQNLSKNAYFKELVHRLNETNYQQQVRINKLSSELQKIIDSNKKEDSNKKGEKQTPSKPGKQTGNNNAKKNDKFRKLYPLF